MALEFKEETPKSIAIIDTTTGHCLGFIVEGWDRNKECPLESYDFSPMEPGYCDINEDEMLQIYNKMVEMRKNGFR